MTMDRGYLTPFSYVSQLDRCHPPLGICRTFVIFSSDNSKCPTVGTAKIYESPVMGVAKVCKCTTHGILGDPGAVSGARDSRKRRKTNRWEKR